MARNTQHALLTTPDSETRARMRFIVAFKRQVEGLRPKGRSLYEVDIAPDLPTDDDEQDTVVAEKLYHEPLYQTVCALKQNGQYRMWDAVKDAILPEAERISSAYKELKTKEQKFGSLELDPELPLPMSLDDTWVHLQPGGYLLDQGEDDVLAGAFYEEGGAVYSMGQGVGTRESKAEMIIRFVGERYPDLKPMRILDIACSAGASSVPYALAFPEAEVHGIDVSAGMLRYAHAKAESLGAAVHFHQMDAGKLDFPDGYFDLVVSHNAMHEMPIETHRKMFKETYRVLRKGGVCVHQDVPLRYENYDAYDRVEKSFDLHFNGELYWHDYAKNNCAELLADAGFDPEQSYCGFTEQSDSTMKWYVATAQK